MIASMTDAVGTWTPETSSSSTCFSAEDCTQSPHEPVEVAVREVAHHGDAEDGAVEFPLAGVDDEALVLEVRVERFVALAFGEVPRRERRAVDVLAIEERLHAELAQRRAHAVRT